MSHDPLLDAWLNDLDDDANYSDYLTLIAAVRQEERVRLLKQLEDEFPKPTLGVQKAMRIVEGSR